MKNKKKGKEFELSLKIEWVKSYLEMFFLSLMKFILKIITTTIH